MALEEKPRMAIKPDNYVSPSSVKEKRLLISNNWEDLPCSIPLQGCLLPLLIYIQYKVGHGQ